MRVFINVGHGGKDSGAIGNNLKEKDIALKIGNHILNGLIKYNLNVKMFRNNDNYYTLEEISKEANRWKADLFVSIHVNAGGGTGFESFIYNGSVSRTTKELQKTLHDEIMKSIKKYNVKDRGKKKANFYVLRKTSMPAVLTENLFIDTVKDAKLLKDDNFLKDLSNGHVNGIVKFTNAKKKITKNSDTYRVVAGSFSNKKNAEIRVKELKEKGFNSFIYLHKK